MDGRQAKIRLCFSIPELDANTHTHHLHIYELLEEIGKHFRVFVVVDRPTRNRYPLKNVENIYFTRFDFFPLRKVEQLFVFGYARFKGYKYFYTHYSLWNALLTSLITKLFGGKTYLWSCHVYKRTKLSEIGSIIEKKKWFTGWLQSFTFKVVDHIVTGTPSVALEYIKEFRASKDKFIIIPNWVNTVRFQPNESGPKRSGGKNKTVAFVHSLTEEKGARYLPDIIKQVVNRIKWVNFIIIGDGLCRDFIKKEVKRNGVQDKVRFFGSIPNKEIPKYLSSTDLLIVPSKNEGFPRIIMEAMAMGIPFVATDVGGIPDIVTDLQRGFVLPQGDIGEFSGKVIELLCDEVKQNMLREEGLRHVTNFTLEKISRMFLEKIR